MALPEEEGLRRYAYFSIVNETVLRTARPLEEGLRHVSRIDIATEGRCLRASRPPQEGLRRLIV